MKEATIMIYIHKALNCRNIFTLIYKFVKTYRLLPTLGDSQNRIQGFMQFMQSQMKDIDLVFANTLRPIAITFQNNLLSYIDDNILYTQTANKKLNLNINEIMYIDYSLKEIFDQHTFLKNLSDSIKIVGEKTSSESIVDDVCDM